MPTETYTLKFQRVYKSDGRRYQTYFDPDTKQYLFTLEECFERGRILLESFNAIQIVKNSEGDEK